MRRAFLCLFVLALALGHADRSALAEAVKPVAGVTTFEGDVRPVLEKYCFGCHGAEKQKADLSLESFKTDAEAQKDRAVWEKVLKNVQSRDMPPENKPQPSDVERALIAEWIDAKVFQVDCSNPDPGRVTLRRLNRNEYNNTIRDLLGVDFHPADDFPSDDTGYGFDNIGDVLSVPPVLLEKYFAAAEKILDTAIVAYPDTNGPALKISPAACQITGPTAALSSAGIKLMLNNVLTTNVTFRKGGDYIIKVRAWGDQCGDEPPKMKLQLGDETLKVFDVPVRQSRAQVYEHRVRVSAGARLLTVAYINNYRHPEHPAPGTCDRNLAIEEIEVVGPAGPQPLPESHSHIFNKSITAPTDTNALARQIVSSFATRAYRRPLKGDEVDRLMSFYELAKGQKENFEASVKLALQAALVSPHFLFRGELQPEPDNPNRVFPINEYALASRLSYFLWSSMPDERLFALAGKGKLRGKLSGEVHRMLRDPKAQAFVENFVGQWLQLRNLNLVQPDPAVFPGFDEALRTAMHKETELLFASILREDRSVMEFLDADYTFLNGRLAQHYGLKGVKGDAFQKVKLKGDQRGGVLTHASVLTLTSHPTRTSPVKRGKWVLENILGTPPPPPPPDVPDLKEGEHEELKGTLRQRMEQHRSNPTCASCHARMDPIGFGLENFDAVGAWRNRDGELPIDPTGTLVSGEEFRGAEDLKKILAAEKKEQFVRCLTDKMLTYALGRGLEYYDKCAVDKICKDVAKRDYKLSALVLGIVNSTPFQMRRGEGQR
jgi:hypothetical protein